MWQKFNLNEHLKNGGITTSFDLIGLNQDRCKEISVCLITGLRTDIATFGTQFVDL